MFWKQRCATDTTLFAADTQQGAALRAYIPNATVKQETDVVRVSDPSEVALGLALVATRPVNNEELLLNYRLSTHVARPAWYTPVDEEEDRRRWA